MEKVKYFIGVHLTTYSCQSVEAVEEDKKSKEMTAGAVFLHFAPISSAVDHPPICSHCPLVLARHRNKRAGHNTGNQYPVGPTANYPLPTALSVPVWLSTKTRRQTLTTKLTFKKGISQKSVKLDPIYQIPHANRVLLRHIIAGI